MIGKTEIFCEINQIRGHFRSNELLALRQIPHTQFNKYLLLLKKTLKFDDISINKPANSLITIYMHYCTTKTTDLYVK